jgi:glycosyltransferase involved in cell wall biosynthesis
MATFTLASLFTLFSSGRFRFDGVIAFFTIPSAPLALAAKILYRIPYVVSLRGGDVPGLTPEVSWMHRLLRPLRSAILDGATAVVANSNGLREMSQASDPVPVRVIPNGVDTDFFQPPMDEATGRRGSDSRLRILFVGRFQKQKNLPYLLEQCSQLPADRFMLHLVGHGPLRGELHRLAEQRAIASSVTWHGWLPRGQLREIYQTCDCLVNPSFYEGLPNVVLEAMACGLPVLASDVSGNNDLVRQDQTGFLFDPAEGDGLRAGLERLLANRDLIFELGANARARVLADYSWRKVAHSYVGLFGNNGSEAHGGSD